jgi:hypothetical protein
MMHLSTAPAMVTIPRGSRSWLQRGALVVVDADSSARRVDGGAGGRNARLPPRKFFPNHLTSTHTYTASNITKNGMCILTHTRTLCIR